MMNNLRSFYRPIHIVSLSSSFIFCRDLNQFAFCLPNKNSLLSSSSSSICTPSSVDCNGGLRFSGFSVGSRRMVARASKWSSDKSPYETLELERNADEEAIKFAYRRLAKYYHPDVYDGRGTLEEGETAEARFIKIQAAYELLIDEEKRQQYDNEHRVNPMKASEAWMEWLIKKRKAFDQRGDMAVAAWAEQQQREMNLRVRRLSRSKIDPEEERRILAREKKASMENFSNTLKRHTLVLKKRDIMRRRANQDQKKVIDQLLAAEGLELENEGEDGA
ncbi:hypothetical protein AMTRI_Chr04g189350 [Amborella trichopoda]